MTRRALTLAAIILAAAIAAAPQAAPQQDSTPAPQNQKETDVFDERAAAAVLGTIRNGLEAHSPRLLLSAFDGDKMDGFLTFQDQIEAYFTTYQSFRVSYHIVQTSEENHRGIILADFQIENEPRDGSPIVHRQAQLRFELERAPKGWKIVDFNPRGFFS